MTNEYLGEDYPSEFDIRSVENTAYWIERAHLFEKEAEELRMINGQSIDRAERSEARVEDLERVLRMVEWIGLYDPDTDGEMISCPWCNMSDYYGHASDCQRQNVLGGSDD